VGLNFSMAWTVSPLPKLCAGVLFCVLFLIICIPQSFAQEPPLAVPGASRLPAQDPNAIAVDGWLLYPTLRLYTLYSDNLFFTPTNPLSAGAIGVTPSMVAVWSNGIHTTTLYGNIDRQDYPSANEVNTLDGRAGITQKYEAMRDLIFTANVTYAHQTWASGLQNSIQTPVAQWQYRAAKWNDSFAFWTTDRPDHTSRCERCATIRESFQSVHGHIFGRQDFQPRNYQPERIGQSHRV
jgi:hypothetical protein